MEIILKNLGSGFIFNQMKEGKFKENDILIRCTKCGFPFVLAEEYIKDKKQVKPTCPQCNKKFIHKLGVNNET